MVNTIIYKTIILLSFRCFLVGAHLVGVGEGVHVFNPCDGQTSESSYPSRVELTGK